jgi:flagellar hook assembly protein FlgD
MSVVFSANVSQSTPVAGVVTLTFRDTTTGLGTVSARTLTIYDYNDDLVQTISMGTSTTATFNVSADGYFTFDESITDNTGTYTGDVAFLCTAFYINAYVTSVASNTTYCGDLYGVVFNQSQAQNYRYAAIDMASFGQGVIAQQLITQANFYITTPYYAN